MAAGLLAGAGIIFIEGNNRHWVQASRASAAVLGAIKGRGEGKIALINLPDEVEGGIVFRNNVEKYFIMNGVDTNKVFVNNYLSRLEYLQVKGDIRVQKRGDGVFIFPCTMIRPDGMQLIIENTYTGKTCRLHRQGDVIYYWDKTRLKSLILEGGEDPHL